ncbi:MAG TPA: phosphoenolpyruvate--protein phosphotransferase [Candidatus Limnocylindrales bacterium]|nr:phosphoenolpyruvate--protein phosphotransferase [Candidatus Limnocylindrales bacterium]
MTRIVLAGRAGSPGIGRGRLLLVGPAGNGHGSVETAPAPAMKFGRGIAAQTGGGTPHGDGDAAAAAAERIRLLAALDTAATELTLLARDVALRAGDEIGAIFEAQALFARDPGIIDPALADVGAGVPADVAILASTDDQAGRLASVDDDYFRARAADVRDVGRRVADLLRGSSAVDLWHADGGPAVIVAEDLDPSAVATLRPELVAGIALAGGAPTGHAAIVARGLGIPLVLGLGAATAGLQALAEALVDGGLGHLIVEPDGHDLEASASRPEEPTTVSPDITPSGDVHVAVSANVGSVLEAEAAARAGADGIGLVRTELLFLGRASPPSVAEQRATYARIRDAFPGRPVVFRTLDVGGDKPAAWQADRPEANPALGLRGVRLGLERPALLDDQLTALLEAASGGEVRIMLPMVATVEEVQAVRRRLGPIAAALEARGIEPPVIELGVMIEVPSAALVADGLADVAAFFSLGTNDLVQYTMAADRTNPAVADLATALQPAVLRLIDGVARAAVGRGRHVAVCGEAAADPEIIPLLVGLGVEELSVAASSVAAVRSLVRTLDSSACRDLAARALGAMTVAEVRALVRGETPG